MTARSCGTCSLCCKVLPVDSLFKPAGKWCSHCKQGKGCASYQLRPQACHDFNCLWLEETWLGEEWKPEVAKFVMSYEYDARCLSVHVDPNQPHAWKRDPSQGLLRAIAERYLGENTVVMVVEPNRRTLLLPDQEIVLGGRDEVFTWEITRKPGAGKPEYDSMFDRVAAEKVA
ncbi:MAG: hypothetical protein ACRC56_12690 [Bosea sp. (in: a-proteobacteria)]